MDKETIEANDLRFRQKVEGLRTQLESRQQTYTRKKKAGLYLKLLVPSFLVMVTAAGYYFWRQPVLREPTVSPAVSAKRIEAAAPSQAPSRAQPCTPQPRAPAQATTALSPPTAPLTPPAPMVVEEPQATEPVEPSPSLASPSAPTVVEESQSAELPVPTTEVVQALPEVEPSVTEPAPVPPPSAASPVPSSIPTPPVPSPVPSTTAPRANPDATIVAQAEPAPPTPTPPVADFRITASRACLDVVARECVGAQEVFALHEHNVPHVWMTVHSQNLPHVLKHVYYHDGERYAEVPLAITYPRMRTWSNVTLQSPNHVGDWRVEIVTEDGTVVQQVQFRVVP